MGLRRTLGAYFRVLRRARPTDKPELLRLLRRRPALLLGMSAYELGLLASGRVEPRLKALAGIKTATLVGCPF